MKKWIKRVVLVLLILLVAAGLTVWLGLDHFARRTAAWVRFARRDQRDVPDGPGVKVPLTLSTFSTASISQSSDAASENSVS